MLFLEGVGVAFFERAPFLPHGQAATTALQAELGPNRGLRERGREGGREGGRDGGVMSEGGGVIEREGGKEGGREGGRARLTRSGKQPHPHSRTPRRASV